MIKVKYLGEIEAVLQDDSIDEDDRFVSYTVCECMSCHWKFIGECYREEYGYTCEGTQIPNYCPMCGGKFDDDLIDDRNHLSEPPKEEKHE